MSAVDCGTTNWNDSEEIPVPVTSNRPLHRLKIVRQQQGLSRRKVAERMNITIKQVREQECETTDLPLSVLYAWQKALDVPIAELLDEVGDSLVTPILERSQLLRLTKTVLAVQRQTRQESVRRMAETMHHQLVEMMPELADVVPWCAVGKFRGLSELGAAAQRRMADTVFIGRGEWSDVWGGDGRGDECEVAV